ncbi:porin family protein [Rapidithrix thailandica]|uniref:Porin family protein n=1 Tax=Rapidithrix thailandica TaxID=413964 RepID=A0AAW9S3U5_9BACT
MKKFIITFLLVSTTHFLLAQDFHWGVRAGAGLYKIDINELDIYDDTRKKFGIDIGLLAKYDFNSQIGIQIEPGFSQKGFKASGIQSLNQERNIHLNYLSLPVLFTVSPFQNFSFLVGPELDLLLSSRESYDGQHNDLSTFFRQTVDLGLDLGISYRLLTRYGVSVKYNYGFMPLVKNWKVDNKSSSSGSDLYNQGWVFNLSYYIQ